MYVYNSVMVEDGVTRYLQAQSSHASHVPDIVSAATSGSYFMFHDFHIHHIRSHSVAETCQHK